MKCILPLLIVIVACKPRERTVSTSATDNVSNIIQTTEGDSLYFDGMQDAADTTRKEDSFNYNVSWTPLAYDSSLYVDQVYSIPGSQELYTAVYYHAQVPEAEYMDHQRAPVDSVLYDDAIELKRSRLPLIIARQYFNLSGLDRVSLYDNDGYICDASFVRVELLYNLIESQFVAVYQPDDPSVNISFGSYCIAPSDVKSYKRSGHSAREIEDEALTDSLKELINIAKDPWRVIHVRTSPDDKVYSSLSFDQGAYLMETIEGKSEILMKVEHNVSIMNIIPVALEVNEKSVLILQMGMNETDMIWTTLATYSGTEYTFMEGSRIPTHLKSN